MLSSKKKSKIQEKKEETEMSTKLSSKQKKQVLRSNFFFFYKIPFLYEVFYSLLHVIEILYNIQLYVSKTWWTNKSLISSSIKRLILCTCQIFINATFNTDFKCIYVDEANVTLQIREITLERANLPFGTIRL